MRMKYMGQTPSVNRTFSAMGRLSLHAYCRRKRRSRITYDLLMNVYDKAIIDVENRPPEGDLRGKFMQGLEFLMEENPNIDVDKDALRAAVNATLDIELEETYVVGTGYGRVRLPFPKEHIRSEILCHGMGAHYV